MRAIKDMPLALKILCGLLVAWAIGSVFAIPQRFGLGLPFFGGWIYKVPAVIVLVILDILGPLAFVVGTLMKANWTPKVAYTYMGLFLLNTIIAFIKFQAQLGMMAILMPGIITLVFLGIVFKERKYFS